VDERIARLKSPEECEQLALNVTARLPELAQAARRRAIELRAAAHGAESDAEEEALQAVYAYERVLSSRHGKKVLAARTWQMIKRDGIIKAVEKAVNRKADASGYKALAAMSLQNMAFEAVVLRHPGVFSREAVERSAERLKNWAQE